MDFGHFDINFDLDCSNGFRHVYWLYLSPIGAFKKIFLPKGRLQPSWAWFWERRQSNPHRQSVESKGLQNPLIWSKIGIWEAKKRVVWTKKFSEFFVFTFLILYFHTLPCLFLAQRGFVYFLCQKSADAGACLYPGAHMIPRLPIETAQNGPRRPKIGRNGDRLIGVNRG